MVVHVLSPSKSRLAKFCCGIFSTDVLSLYMKQSHYLYTLYNAAKDNKLLNIEQISVVL